jgi:hypothetical protein
MGVLDDFDWQDIAMAGSLAEEMADEELERRRLERELERERDEAEDDVLPRRGAAHRPHRRPGRHSLFLKWANDVSRGVKRPGDPLLGPPRPQRPGERPMGRYTRTEIAGVPVLNAHLVSETFLKVAYLLFISYPDHGIRAVAFDPAGKTVVDGQEVFGTFEPRTRTVTINLHRHLENALRIAAHGISPFSVRHTLWKSMVAILLHELKHALDTAGAGLPGGGTREEQEEMAEVFEAEIGTALHCRGDLEPPAPQDDPYFGPRALTWMKGAWEEGRWTWAERQLAMLRDGVLVRSDDPAFELRTEKELHDLSLEGLRTGAGRGKALNDLVSACRAREAEAWERDERRIAELESAVAGGHRLRIRYAAAEGETAAFAVTPRAVVRRDWFVWLHAAGDATGSPAFFRIDRILEVEPEA